MIPSFTISLRYVIIFCCDSLTILLENEGELQMEKKKKFQMPHTYIIIFCVILFAAILTMFIPLGKYETKEITYTERERKRPEPFWIRTALSMFWMRMETG